MLTCILYSGVAATRKRKAPSSTHSVVNFGDLSPETLARVDKAVKIAEKEAPGPGPAPAPAPCPESVVIIETWPSV